MEITRDLYLNQLISLSWNGQVKVITVIRRCGKSYLLRTLYRNHLLNSGIDDDHIISIELDLARDIRYRSPLELTAYVRSRIDGKAEPFYLFIDEIQMSDEVPNPNNPAGKAITFYDALNDLKSIANLDVYVTGSNSRMLSVDILTEFRGRGDEIRVHPLSFAEYYSAVGGDKNDAFDQYAFFGGMPLLLSRPDDEARMPYLKSLFSDVYIKDILERRRILREDVLSDVLDLLCSSVGSLTNPTTAAHFINSMKKLKREDQVSHNTVKAYMGHLEDAFLFHECKRYDIKVKSYFDYPNKYYCEDIGIVFSLGKSHDGKLKRIAREIDFIALKGSRKVYIQSAYAMGTDIKTETELKPLSLTGDSFPKIIVRHDVRKRWYDDSGILNIGIVDFLLDESLI